MATADAVRDGASISVDRRRHSIDVASMTFQLLKQNGVSDLQTQSTSSVAGKRNRNGNGNGTSFVDEDDVLKEGQGQGLFRRNGLGFITRLSPSGRPMTSLPVTDERVNLGSDASSARRNASAVLRSTSPRPTSRRAPVVTFSSDDLHRAASYEEELETRLKNVRQRTLDVERRFMTEQLKRRQAMLLAEVLERQHLETVTRLSAEMERRIDQLKARYEEVREDCRRRIAVAENRSIATVERLETELSETKLQLERYKNSRASDSTPQCDAHTQVNLDDEVGTTKTQSSQTTGSVADEVDERSSSPLPLPGEKHVESEQIWDCLYDAVTSLALCRVRYLEEQISAMNQRGRQPAVVRGQLRRLRALRRRAVAGDTDVISPKTRSELNSAEATPSPVFPVKSIVRNSQNEQLPVENKQSAARRELQRMSSGPSPEVVTVALGDFGRSRSVTEDTDHIDDTDMTSSLAESRSESVAAADLSFSSLPTVSELSDSASNLTRQSTCSDIETPIDLSTSDLNAIATSTMTNPPISPTNARSSSVAMTTPQAEETTRRKATRPKRNSTLSLDIFRKLQGNKRRERPSSLPGTPSVNAGTSSPGTPSLNAGSDDDRSDVFSVGQKQSPRSSTSSSNADVCVSPTKAICRQSALEEIERAASTLDTSSSSSTSSSDGSRHNATSRHSLPSSQTLNSDDSSSTLVEAVDDGTPETTSLNDVVNDDVLSSNSKRRTRANVRPKSSSFCRLHERRNGLVSMTSSSTGGLLPSQPRMTSQSRLDSFAKNIKTYLTSQ